MKTNVVLLILLIAAAMPVSAMSLHQPSPVFTIDGKLNCPVMTENGGTAYLQLTVTAPHIAADQKRKPLNLSVVIDRSGSMSDQKKMEYAKKAFSALIDRLQPNDVLSLVVYDDAVDVLRKAKKIGSDRAAIKKLVDDVFPRGSTNLGGGLQEGLRQAQRFAGKEYVSRVVLLSDGLANVGVTDPAELNAKARKFRNISISVSTMGVGLDYNENLMLGLSESGGGNYYFIEHPNSLASIVRKEFDMVSSILAQNASVYLTLGHGVQVADVVGCEFSVEQQRYIIPVGDLYSGETREFTVELTIPAGSGKKLVSTGELRYESGSIIAAFPKFSADVTYTHDHAEMERKRDINTQAKADIAVSARKVEQAMQAMDEGRQEDAAEMLNEAKDVIASSPAASAAGAGGESVRSQMGKIETYQKTAKEETDSRKAKKSIQFDNYKTRKNK